MSKFKDITIILGSPASGKTTLARRLARCVLRTHQGPK